VNDPTWGGSGARLRDLSPNALVPTRHDTRLTRTGLIRAGIGAGLALATGARSLRAMATPHPLRGSLVLNATELAQVRANIVDLKLRFARRAWARTLGDADNWLGYEPQPTNPDDVEADNWHETLYTPGLRDGNAAYTLSVAYAVSGRTEYALRTKRICLAWARTYTPIPPPDRVGHMVAEPVGPVIKLCMAYELAKPIFTQSERREFASWAGQFVARGIESTNSARDHPWVPDVTYGDDRTNVAPYGNSATWQRAMAVWAAVAVGSETLRSTLRWNFQHRTPAGLDYGWDNLLEGLIIDGAGGQLCEDRYRSSIEYGHFSWVPLVLIADVSRRARFRPDLFAYRTQKHGYTVFTPFSYYGPLVTRETVDPGLERTQYGGSSWPQTASRWRAMYELLYRNASDQSLVRRLAEVVNYGGPRHRGDNYDIYILNHAPLFGRGPHGPMAQPKPKH
jgi:Alginate lyase